MKFKKIHILISLSFFAIACSSPIKTSFYQLKTIETAEIYRNKLQSKQIRIQLNPIKFPEYLDHPQIVIRNNAYKLQLSENHHWAEPLENEFTRIFIDNFNRRIAPNHILGYSELKNIKANIQLSIKVLQLDVSSSEQAVLSVKWGVLNSKNTQWFSKNFSIPVENNSYEAKVEAQSQLIALLSDYIIKNIDYRLQR